MASFTENEKFCHHLLILILYQNWIGLDMDFCNTKEYILKKVGDQTVPGPRWLP